MLDGNLCQVQPNIKFYDILCICSQVILVLKFLSQTDIYFHKIVNHAQNISKRVNPTKTRNRKYLRKRYDVT